MSFGSIVAQSINILIQPILTRIVPPSTLGEYTYIVSLAVMVIPVASLKLDMLVVSEKDDVEAQYITDVCIIVCLFLSLCYALIISFSFMYDTPNALNKYGLVVYFVPIIIFTNGLRFLFISYNNRYRQYKLISVIGIIRESSRAVMQVFAGLSHLGVVGQVVGYAFAPIFGFTYQTKEYFHRFKQRTLISSSQIKGILWVKGKRQIIYLVPAQFFNSLSNTIIILSISELYSSTSLGYYSVGARLLEIPLVLITANISKVCYRQISEMVLIKKSIFPLVSRISLLLFIVSGAGFGILFLVAPVLTRIVFGDGYEIAGEYTRCLCIMYVIRFVTTSFSGLFTIFKKQNYELLINIAIVIFSILLFLFCRYCSIQIEGYLWLISVFYSLIYFVLWVGYMHICHKHDSMLVLNHK